MALVTEQWQAPGGACHCSLDPPAIKSNMGGRRAAPQPDRRIHRRASEEAGDSGRDQVWHRRPPRAPQRRPSDPRRSPLARRDSGYTTGPDPSGQCAPRRLPGREVRVTRSSQILGGDTPSVPRNSFIGDLSEPASDPRERFCSWEVGRSHFKPCWAPFQTPLGVLHFVGGQLTPPCLCAGSAAAAAPACSAAARVRC